MKRIVVEQSRESRKTGSALAIFAAFFTLGTSVPAAAQTFVSIDPAGSILTWAISINAHNQIAGEYEDKQLRITCFIRNKNSQIYKFSADGTTVCGARGINNGGLITGYVGNADTPCMNAGAYHGFVRTPSGTLTQFDPTGSISTEGASINVAGDIAGFYLDSTCVYHGFLRDSAGTITPIDADGAGSGPFEGTQVFSVNDNGTSAGTFFDADGINHGLVFDGPNGNKNKNCGKGCRAFDVRGAGTNKGIGRSINNAGAITGEYTDINGAFHGFLRAPDGTITKFDAPGAGTEPGQGTNGVSINKSGVIAGNFVDSNNIRHGFIRSVDGTITQIDFPNGTNTRGRSINASGYLTGYYVDSDGRQHGYLRSP